MYIKGVNLGNWLVLEKWMSPHLFDGTTAEDEYYLPTQLSKEVYEARIMVHRSEYITERDFANIKAMGMNAVRIPTPYFIFGDCPPFLGCVEEMDRAFAWAKKYGLKILIDLHTVPGSQNGFDNGGISGVCMWSQDPQKVEFALTVLERLAQRYGNHESLWGIQVVNEPIMEEMWEIMHVQERYKPVNPEWAAASKANSFEFLQEFYMEAYHRLRSILPEEKVIVFHDGFNLLIWKDFFRNPELKNVVLDTHQYLMTAESMGCAQTLEGYAEFVETHFAKDIEIMQQIVPTICGEWCLFNSYACGRDTNGGVAPLDGEAAQVRIFTAEEQAQIYRTIADIQLNAWKKGSGYFYWNYKLLLDTVNEPEWIGWDCWDLGKCVNEGWFPVQE